MSAVQSVFQYRPKMSNQVQVTQSSLANHVFIVLTLCTGIQSYWNKFWLHILAELKRSCKVTAYRDIHYNYTLPTLWQQFVKNHSCASGSGVNKFLAIQCIMCYRKTLETQILFTYKYVNKLSIIYFIIYIYLFGRAISSQHLQSFLPLDGCSNSSNFDGKIFIKCLTVIISITSLITAAGKAVNISMFQCYLDR